VGSKSYWYIEGILNLNKGDELMKFFDVFRLYSVREIAEITDLKENKITFLLRKGTLKGRKVGRIWYSRGFYISKMMSQNRKLKELKNKFETR